MNKDLISRSALLGGYDVRKVTEYDESGCGLEYKAVSVEAIEAAPAIDAEPVRHGRWVAEIDRMGNYAHCSECGCRCRGYVPNYNYCPNCGAKMDGGKNEREKAD